MVKPSLSIILPCHNEEEVIECTYRTLKKLLDQWLRIIISTYEIVMVNNGSTDKTMDAMLRLKAEDKNIKIIDLRRNFGYQGSLTAGLFHSTADVAVTIDADLQDDPAKIAEMVGKYQEGYDMVLGIRSSRSSDGFFKRQSANIFYYLLNKFGVRSIPHHGDFRLLSRSLVEEFKSMSEVNRYIRGMILSLESRYACVYYDRTPRTGGKTKFNFVNLASLALDGITSFSIIPIRIVFGSGCFMFFSSVVGVGYVFYFKFIAGLDVPGWASILTTLLFFGGIQNLSLGIIGEYVAKTYLETKKRPLFSVRRIY
jgi:glycosyltransferase involved in cell wall biosynthesis